MDITNKYIKYILLILFFQSFCLIGYAQMIAIKGRAIDDGQKGIPNINIFLKDTRIGTVSDQNGSFSITLPSTYRNQYLYFTGISYQKDSLLIQKIQSPVTIKLHPETYRLSEVYVMPDSTLLTLLRRAYNKIPDNYPVVPTMYEGFYRESTQNTDKEQADFIEAILSIYKESYEKPSRNPGQIEILKSRKKRLRNTGILYYGGPATTIRKDFVLSRADFISPRHFKNYQYTFNGIMKMRDKEFYEISFIKTAKDTSLLNGTMLIEKESLAYVSFDIAKDTESIHPRVKTRKSNEKIRYEQIDDKWYFQYYTYTNTDFLRFSDNVIHGSLDYATTHIQTDSVKPIPYERQLQILDPLILKAEEYNPDGWTDYDILKNVESGRTNFQFSQVESAEIFSQKSKATSAEKIAKIIPFLLQFYYDIGISYKPVSVTSTTSQFSFQPNSEQSSFMINKNQKEESEYILIQGSIGYKFNKNISAFYQGSSDLFNKSISSNEHYIGVTYQRNIKPTGYPLLLQGSLLFGFRNYYSDLGKYDNPSTFHYKGTKIDSRVISFDYGKQQKAIIPQIALTKSMSRFFSLKLYVGYNFKLDNKNVFRIKEEKGNYFTKKKVTISANDPDLQFIDNSINIWDSLTIHKWQAGISIVFN